MPSRRQALYVMSPESFTLAYGTHERAEIDALVDIIAPSFDPSTMDSHRTVLSQAEIIFSGWGGPRLDHAFLEAAPRLKAVFHAAGSLSTIVTDAAWDRGIRVTSAYAANAIPVAEYCLAVTLFSLKHGWRHIAQTKHDRHYSPRHAEPGCFGTTVGLVSLGMIGRTFRRLLRPFDLRVIAYDPFLSAAEAHALNVELVSLDDIFRRADVVSIHTPHLPETEGIITGKHLDSMKNGATFINTSRGSLVRELELIAVAARRPDLQIILDVSSPEPPAPDSPLYVLPNVVLTPHIAGSVGPECRRMGAYMVEELRRYLKNEPLQWSVTRDFAARTSHRPVITTRPPPIKTSPKKIVA